MQQIVSVNGQTVNILGFSEHMASVAITKLCWNSVKTIDNMDISKHSCAPITIYFQKQERQDLTHGL